MEQSSPKESSRTSQHQILVETLSLVEFKKARTSLSSKGSPKKELTMALRKVAMTSSRNFLIKIEPDYAFKQTKPKMMDADSVTGYLTVHQLS